VYVVKCFVVINCDKKGYRGGGQMNNEEMLKEISRLSRMKNNWYSMATISEQYIVLQGGDRTGQHIQNIAANSGLHPNTLNRMMSVRNFLDSVKDQIQNCKKVVDLNDLSYPNLELVKRLYQTNQKLGIKLLNEVVEGKITFRELRKKYNEIIAENMDNASSKQTAKIKGRNFKALALAAIKSASYRLFEGQIMTIDSPPRLLSIDAAAYELSPTGSECAYAGFEFIAYHGQTNWNTILDTLLHRSVFLCNFFKRFWIVFSENTGRECISGFSNILQMLDCPSIGVAVLLESGQLEVVHSPTGDSIQNWSQKLETFLERRSDLLNTKP